MNNPRPTNSKGNGQLVQWNTSQTQGQQQSPQPAPYNLPGVINYLTSEFTNLERYKIVSNLERSEMKYKILELQGEVNSLKFVNSKQLTRIQELERELGHTENKDEGTPEDTSDPALPKTIPELDLLIIKQSRDQLTKSMKEIVHLLKVPSAKSTNYLDLPDGLENDLDVLLDHENTNGDDHLKRTRKSLTSQYFDDESDAEEYPKQNDEPYGFEKQNEKYNVEDLIGSQIIDPSGDKYPYESDTETEIFDDLAGKTTQLYDDGSYKTQISYYTDRPNDSILLKVTHDDSQVFLRDCNLTHIKADDIVDIYPIQTDEKWLFLIVESSGLIQELRIDDTISEQTLTDFTESTKVFKSTSLIEFTEKSNATSRSYGFVYNSDNNAGAFVLKVLQLTIGDKPTAIDEIARFTGNFLTKNSEYTHHEFVEWQVVDVDVLHSPKQSKKKRAGDPKLAKYELVYEGVKNGEKGRFGVNIVLQGVTERWSR